MKPGYVALILLLLAVFVHCADKASHAATRLVPKATYLPKKLEHALEIDKADGQCYSAVDRWMLNRTRNMGVRAYWKPTSFDC